MPRQVCSKYGFCDESQFLAEQFLVNHIFGRTFSDESLFLVEHFVMNLMLGPAFFGQITILGKLQTAR
jgi:hypothetical protein